MNSFIRNESIFEISIKLYSYSQNHNFETHHISRVIRGFSLEKYSLKTLFNFKSDILLPESRITPSFLTPVYGTFSVCQSHRKIGGGCHISSNGIRPGWLDESEESSGHPPSPAHPNGRMEGGRWLQNLQEGSRGGTRRRFG
jgi:hypothetical protein